MKNNRLLQVSPIITAIALHFVQFSVQTIEIQFSGSNESTGNFRNKRTNFGGSPIFFFFFSTGCKIFISAARTDRNINCRLKSILHSTVFKVLLIKQQPIAAVEIRHAKSTTLSPFINEFQFPRQNCVRKQEQCNIFLPHLAISFRIWN